jgi:RNA polymerase sigma-70 factor, ECF subfamily
MGEGTRRHSAHDARETAQQRTGDGRVDGAGQFGALMMPHLPAMLHVAAALVGTADAEDAAQEAVLRAWQAWEALREPGALRSWLLRITTHVCQDWQRGRFGTRRARTLPLLDADGGPPLALLGTDPGASDHTGALDLRQAINRLDADLRVVLVLRYYADMDASEIGAALGMPSATVRTRLRRALQVLRERLDAPSTRVTPTEKGGR